MSQNVVPDPPPRSPAAQRVAIAGLVLAVVLGVTGLVVVAGAVLFMVAINSWADNK